MCAGLLWSCSDKEANEPGDVQVPAGTLMFDISTVEKMDTRTGRPLYSQEAAHTVDKMSVYVFKKDGSGNYLWNSTMNFDSEWTAGTTSKCLSVKIADVLPAGDYKFLAVGTDLNNLFSVSVNPTTNINNVLASLNNANNASEIFTGQASATISGTIPGVRVQITATRKVAGLLAYLKNVPVTYNEKVVDGVKVMINQANKSVNLITGVGSDIDATWTTFIDIPMLGQVPVDGMYSGNIILDAYVVKLPLSQLKGAYALPVDNIQMKIVLYGGLLGAETIKEWVVKDGLNTTFSLLPNHFYSLGKKESTGSTTDDEAINLLDDQEICITIDPNWAQFHYLNIQ